MSKKLGILIGAVVLVVAAGAGYFIVNSSGKSDSDFFPAAESIITKETAAADLEYSDESGFSFKYPKSLRVEDITPSDDSYYSKVSLIKGGEKLTITVRDEAEKTIDAILLSDDYYKDASLVGATTLAGISAKEYSMGDKLITIALKDGIVYLIEGNKDAGFWEDTQGVVISTFTFGLRESDGPSDENTTYESEVIVE